MANRERGELRLVAGDQVFTLRLTVGSCCEVEDRAEQDLDDLIAGVNRGSMQALRWLLWASLQAKHGDRIARPEDVGPVMDATGSTTQVRARLKAFLDLNADDRPRARSERAKARPPSRHPWRELYMDARCLGLSADQFWDLSLKELWLELGVAQKQRERDLTLAWYIGAFCGWKKLPNLQTLLRSSGGQVEQSPDEQVAALYTISELYGLRLKVTKKKDSHGAR